IITKSKLKKFVIMIDIDHFKSINDTYGHVNGDLILKNVAIYLNEITYEFFGGKVILARYGGEEFILLVEAKTKDDIIGLVENIRKGIEKEVFYTEDKTKRIHLTVSIGVSELTVNNNLYQAIERADQSLYLSKRLGRNQIHYA